MYHVQLTSAVLDAQAAPADCSSLANAEDQGVGPLRSGEF
jgi:hypothetical protein